MNLHFQITAIYLYKDNVFTKINLYLYPDGLARGLLFRGGAAGR